MRIIRLLLLVCLLSPASALLAQVYTTTNICTGLQYSVAFDFSGDGRIFLTQKGDGSTPSASGSAIIKTYTIGGTFLANFYDLSDSVNSDFERGLLGVCVDPDFLTNHYVYAYYNHFLANSERIRIVRFTELANVGTNPQVIFDLDITSYNIPGNHVGGNIHFRPSDPTHIYFSIGDLAYNQTSAGNYAPLITLPYGKFLRIGKDPVPVGSNVHAFGVFNCNVPTDNPFYDDGNPSTGNCDIIWSYGHRNAFDFCFGPNDSLYSTENGLNTWDELNMIQRGKDYGWNTCEGFYNRGSTSVLCSNPTSILPMEDWSNPPALTGAVYYSSIVMPEFTDHLLVADNDNGIIYDLTLGNAPAYDQVTSRVTWQNLAGGLTTIKVGPEGCVYAMKGGYTTSGLIYKICPQGLGTEDFQNAYFSLEQNQPNPFSTTTTLNYSMKQESKVKIVLYDMFGREVAILADGSQSAGSHILEINAEELNLAPGNYFCSMQGEGAVQSVKISVVQ
ncbi:MAG: PQQ-dependent sugar dehydrogenase [Bacteroidota bacterium]|nr:PQQ-dependent sugar dehydrogenase [Bacteroidota bacterium]